MNIAVVGTGYVGLVTGTCFAEMGNQVTCVDIDAKKVEAMQQGRIPIYEPHLDVLFERNIKQGRLQFTTDLKSAVIPAQVVFLALPTPPGEDGSADLSYVLGVASNLGGIIDSYKVIVNKSTVPVGTAEKVRDAIAKTCKSEFDVVSNPEFLREGYAVDDFMKPDRVVIGTDSERAGMLMKELYAPFVRQGNPIYMMDTRSSELTKYAANAFLATKITFMNEIANLCERTGANVDMVRIGIGSDDRIGKRFLFAGIGYGGSCFPKDVQALAKTSDDYGYEFRVLDSVMKVNATQRTIIFDKIMKFFGNNISSKRIAVWGLAFKPDTDDIREAPALFLIEKLLSAGASVSVFDPEAMPNVEKVFGSRITYANDQYECVNGADGLLIATEWAVFRTPDFDLMSKAMKSKVVFDGRNLYEPSKMQQLGFHYESIGRQPINPN
ncbi:MAG: UDP-glucose dehydrogenase family protein [Bacteroidota bacterium]